MTVDELKKLLQEKDIEAISFLIQVKTENKNEYKRIFLDITDFEINSILDNELELVTNDCFKIVNA